MDDPLDGSRKETLTTQGDKKVMAQKKEMKPRDLKPSKDAKGGAARGNSASVNRATAGRSNDARRSNLGGARSSADRGAGRTAN